jgi:hypothetical protein
MSNRFKNPLVPLIEEPVNIDRPIQEMQQALAGLGWLEKSFGRAYESYKTMTGPLGTTTKVYPEVWQGVGKDLLEVLPNDNLKSQSFFRLHEPQEVIDYVMDGYSMMRATVSIIFWFNLKEIDPTIDYRYIELLKGQVQRVLTTMLFSPDSSLKVSRIFDTADRVFETYDLSNVRDQELVHPFGGFRFEVELTYREDCPDVVLN